jgi:hypothetical protein
VLVWDTGTFRNLRAEKAGDGSDLAASLVDGLLQIWLDGEKLNGGYALKRTDGGDKAKWLAIKMDDSGADAQRNPTSTQPDSVTSGRSLDEIDAQERDDEH